jgi:hypothetical protein
MSDAAATLLAGLAGGLFALLAVWIGFLLSRLASEDDRRIQALVVIYQNIEALKNLLIAFQKRMIEKHVLHPKWTRTTENVLVALVRSGLNRKDKKRVFYAINGKWEDPKSVTALAALADELLNKIDPDYAQAGKEFLRELGIKPEDIDPVILVKE